MAKVVGAQPSCRAALPFDLLFGARDANGLPLDPEWAWQCDYHVPTFEFPPLYSRLAVDFGGTEDPFVPNVSEYPDPYELCNKFKYSPAHDSLEIGPECSDEISEWDAPVRQRFPSEQYVWYTICHFPGESDSYVHGHVNFVPVTYTGHLRLKDVGEPVVSDRDTNLKLYPDASTGPQLGVPTTPGLTPANVESAPGAAVEDASLHLEYDTVEIMPALKSRLAAWDRGLEQASYVQGQPQGVASVIGLMGLDDRHEAKTELHPVYAFAVREKPGVDGADRWLVMFRNWGDEGGCSGREHLRHQLTTPGGRVTLTLSSPSGPVSSVSLGPKLLQGANVRDGEEAPIAASLAIDHRHAELSATLPPPSARAVLVGEITLDWGQTTPTAPHALSETLEPPQVQLGPAAKGEVHEPEPDQLLVGVTKLLDPSEQHRLQVLLHGRLIASAPRAACPVLGPAAARAARAHRYPAQVELVRKVLACRVGA